MVTTVPEKTSSLKVDEILAAEAVRAAELSREGYWVQLWRPPLGPGEWRSIGLFKASNEADHKILDSSSSYLDEGHHYSVDTTSK